MEGCSPRHAPKKCKQCLAHMQLSRCRSLGVWWRVEGRSGGRRCRRQRRGLPAGGEIQHLRTLLLLLPLLLLLHLGCELPLDLLLKLLQLLLLRRRGSGGLGRGRRG